MAVPLWQGGGKGPAIKENFFELRRKNVVPTAINLEEVELMARPFKKVFFAVSLKDLLLHFLVQKNMSVSRYAMFNLSKTTSPQKLFLYLIAHCTL